MGGLVRTLRTHYQPLVVAYDGVLWVLAAIGAALLRYPRVDTVPWADVLVLGFGSGILFLLVARAMKLHQGRARTASFDEFLLIAIAAGITGATATLVNIIIGVAQGGEYFSRAVPIIATLVFLVLAMGGRVAWRHFKERDIQRSGSGTPTLIVGAGFAGESLVRSMQRDALRQWEPIGLIDDDPRKRNLRVEGLPVIGTIAELTEKIHASGAEAVALAIPSASPALVNKVSRAADAAGVQIKVIPPTTELLFDHIGIRSLRDINLNDVLGRNQLDTDVEAIAGYITGKRVLVTGAGGSIGSELCRQINRFGPAELMMLDRDESALHGVSLSIHHRALLDGDDVILADIRDVRALYRIFTERRPEVVFHAAALKHLPMLEQYPAEAVKTNVIGTRNVLDAAVAAGVERFVNISTDKAANPSSVLGYSKRIAERVTSSYANLNTDGVYLSVRFGNVLGSRGSVLTTFADQIARGGPVTVTDPGVTRFFMTIEEACQLVIQAGAIGNPGEALVLDMGEPISILSVAQQLIEQSGRNIPIEFTGLRPGEKMHEELFADSEPQDIRPRHPLVSHVPVPGIDDIIIDRLPRLGPAVEVTGELALLCANEEPLTLSPSLDSPSASHHA